MKKIPVGIENFKEIIDDQYYYIDKTELINDVMNEKLVLYTRPRRFGKTLNMSMLYYFFSHKEKDNAYLFDGLNVSKDNEVMLHQNQYPVIFMTLKDMKNRNAELQKQQFLSLIQTVLEKNIELLHSEKVNFITKKRLESLVNNQVTDIDLQNALYYICVALKQHYQKNVILLIDEYDVPLQSAYTNGYYDEMVDFLRNVFSSALKTNDALEKGVLTGCLRISKESIFTGLNNFNVYSIMDEQSSTRFGFTQQEVNELLNEYNFLEQKVEEAQAILNDILFKDISYYDNSEAFYHGFLVGLMQEYGISSNKESGEGRLDIFIKPRRADRKVIVIECKHSQKESEIVKDSEVGARQIIEKKYLEGIKVNEQREAIGYGIAFYKKRCIVTAALK